jgi:putative DNA primase/helicase
MTGTVERARHRWREILPQLGIDTRFLTNKHGPCPLCGGRDRFRFDDKDGVGSYICGQCGAGVGVILLRKLHGWDFKTACDEIDKIVGRDGSPPKPTPATDEAKKKARHLDRIERLLAEAIDDRVVSAFLRNRRITVTSPTLLGHPACPYFCDGKLVGRFPAVVAPILAPDGSLESAALLYCATAPEPRKKFLPVVNTINGAAVRLYDPIDGRLGFAEGIANAMAARQLFGVPTWASLSANGMKTAVLPPDVDYVTIFADHDRSHAGQAAAYALAQRLGRAGIRAEVKMPTVIGTDFADLLPGPKEHS